MGLLSVLMVAVDLFVLYGVAGKALGSICRYWRNEWVSLIHGERRNERDSMGGKWTYIVHKYSRKGVTLPLRRPMVQHLVGRAVLHSLSKEVER
jgi:hypothetical protein